MSLIAFHRFLIATGILFCGGFALWELLRFLDAGDWRSLLLAVGFAAASGALGYYLRHLSRFLGMEKGGAARGPQVR